MNATNKLAPINIEKALAENPATIPASAVTEARSELVKVQHEIAKRVAMTHLLAHDERMKRAVARLREAREEEKRQLTFVKALDAAGLEFCADGNVDKYNATINKADRARLGIRD